MYRLPPQSEALQLAHSELLGRIIRYDFLIEWTGVRVRLQPRRGVG